MISNFNLIILYAFFVGFIGDAILQIITANTSYDWGLRKYFSQHGRPESLFIAGGMLVLFYSIIPSKFLSVTPFNIALIALYGIVLDLIFRKTMVFKSLDGYYNHLNYFWSGVWGAIPLVLPLLAASVGQRLANKK